MEVVWAPTLTFQPCVFTYSIFAYYILPTKLITEEQRCWLQPLNVLYTLSLS